MSTVIIGAGHAGTQCAVSLRSEGYEGDIVLINDDVSVPYHKPPLSKKYLRADNPEATALRAASAYEKASINWIHGHVESVDIHEKTVRMSDGTSQGYSQLVFATGARNRTLPNLSDCNNVFSLRTVGDAEALHQACQSAKTVAVLGGGFIGLEVAACLAEMGKVVHVIEAADRLLGRVVAPEVSSRVHSALTAMGVDVNIESKNTEFNTDQGALQSVSLSDKKIIHADVMLVGIGAIPNTELADAASISCDNGIVVNQKLETSVAGIYAIGDCAQFPHWQTDSLQRLESVQNAVDQAKTVAKTIASGEATEFQTVPWFWSDIGALKLQIAGIHNGNTETVIRETENDFALYHLKEGVVVSVETLNNAKDHMLARKLIAASTKVTADDVSNGVDALKEILNS